MPYDSIMIKDYTGKTAFDIATQAKFQDCIELFKSWSLIPQSQPMEQ